MEKHTLDWFLSFTAANGDCLEWTRCFNTDGYPRALYRGSANGKVHRIVYELSTGDDPSGKVVRHKCDNTRCINPNHLEIGDSRNNVEDRVKRGRTHGHVTIDEVYSVRSLRELGDTYKEISVKLGIHIKRVEYIANKYLK